MRPAPFTYSRPHSLEAAVSAVAAGAMPLSGGQSLIQNMRLRRLTPDAVVDLSKVAELSDEIRQGGALLRIGARVTHAMLARDPLVAARLPWLAEAASRIGDVQVRNRGTTLGNLCWADPRANMGVALLASDASVLAVGAAGATSRIPLHAFFGGFQTTTLADRLALEIEVPLGPESLTGAYLEQSRQPQDLALVNVCVVAGSGFRPVRIAVGGIHQTPVRLAAAERVLAAGGTLEELSASLPEMLRTTGFAPVKDHHASEGYRLILARHLIETALQRCGRAHHA